MDPLSDVISLLEPRSYLVGGFEAGGDWSIRFDPFNGIKCYAVTAGACWLAIEGVGEPVLLEEGDCFLLPRGRPFSARRAAVGDVARHVAANRPSAKGKRAQDVALGLRPDGTGAERGQAG